MMRLFNKKQVGESELEDSLENIEADAMDVVEYVVEQVNKKGVFGLFNYYHKKQRDNEYNYAMVEGADHRKNYLLNQIERVNCAYEKTLETMKDFYECSRRG